ncbi:MAG: bifunctional riboflavin kinase/FAD synthetase [Anaerolineae bacterium]|nr:MAG: bifunctional riboflavin kinase/FAD synthetase [Anaerolineae bacterium]
MQHTRDLQSLSLTNTFLSVGVFDGVHRGHRAILEPMVAAARAAGTTAVALTFDPHPTVVFSGPRDGFLLTSPEERAELLGALGLDVLITFPFSRDAAATPARDFVEALHARLGLKELWVGHDFAMGYKRQGDVSTLRALGAELGFTVNAVPALENGDGPISSTRIRQHLAAGEVQFANSLLGREYSLRGVVIRGDGRGRTIGIPTANLNIPPDRATPANGVYAGWAQIGAERVMAVTNIGLRPTFEQAAPRRTVEAHLLDFDRDLYGTELALSFAARLRGEQKFSDIDALVAQIRNDIEQARQDLQTGQGGAS